MSDSSPWMEGYNKGIAAERARIVAALRRHAERPSDWDDSDDSKEDRYWLGYFDAADEAVAIAEGGPLKGPRVGVGAPQEPAAPAEDWKALAARLAQMLDALDRACPLSHDSMDARANAERLLAIPAVRRLMEGR